MKTDPIIKRATKDNRKYTRKQLLKRLDLLVSKYVILRDKRCVVCGSTQSLTNGHVFSRRHYNTRWDLTNCFTQCWPCNFKHTHDTYPYFNWYVKTFGQEKFDSLYRKFSSSSTVTEKQMAEMIVYFNRLIENL